MARKIVREMAREMARLIKGYIDLAIGFLFLSVGFEKKISDSIDNIPSIKCIGPPGALQNLHSSMHVNFLK